jgi:glycosyltransferase involved in cell wall biosynthesis
VTKRLLHVIPSLDPGDIQEQVRLLAVHLPREEYELHICAFRSGPMCPLLQDAGASVHVLPRRLTIDPWTLHALMRHIARLKPELVQTWQFTANTHGRLAALRAGMRRLVAVERSLDSWKGWPHWLLDRRLARLTSVIVVNHGVLQEYYAARGVNPGRFCAIPDGIAMATSLGDVRNRLLAELNLTPAACLVGASGTLETANRFKDLIWAIDILKWVHTDVHLVILGDGPQRGRLMRFVDCVEVADRVHFLGARIDAQQIVSSCDYLWHAATQDAVSTALAAALAAGVPIVALDTPAHRSLITPGENGFLAEVDDRPAFARWTHKMLEDSALRQKIAAGGMRAGQRFTAETCVQNYRRLYEELLA